MSSNSQDSSAHVSGNKISYQAWQNTNVTYDITSGMIKENFILYSLPSIKEYLYLQYDGNIKFNKTLQICTETKCYKPSGTADDFNTSGKIYFKTATNRTVFWLNKPVITDSAGHTTTGIYVVHGSDAQMNFYLRIPTAFLKTATFPISIDPTIQTLVTENNDTHIHYAYSWGNMDLRLKCKNKTGEFSPANQYVQRDESNTKWIFGANDDFGEDYNCTYTLTSSSELVQTSTGGFYSFYPNGWDELRQIVSFDGLNVSNFSVSEDMMTANINFKSNGTIATHSIFNMTGCTTMVLNRIYMLNKSITYGTDTDCMNFFGNNITLDCDGYSITCNVSLHGQIAFSNGFSNIVIQNCTGVSNSYFSTAYGFYVINGQNITIKSTRNTGAADGRFVNIKNFYGWNITGATGNAVPLVFDNVTNGVFDSSSHLKDAVTGGNTYQISSCNNFTASNIVATATSGSGGGDTGFSISGGSNITLVNVTVTNIKNYGIYSTVGLTIINSTITNGSVAAIRAQDANNFTNVNIFGTGTTIGLNGIGLTGSVFNSNLSRSKNDVNLSSYIASQSCVNNGTGLTDCLNVTQAACEYFPFRCEWGQCGGIATGGCSYVSTANCDATGVCVNAFSSCGGTGWDCSELDEFSCGGYCSPQYLCANAPAGDCSQFSYSDEYTCTSHSGCSWDGDPNYICSGTFDCGSVFVGDCYLYSGCSTAYDYCTGGTQSCEVLDEYSCNLGDCSPSYTCQDNGFSMCGELNAFQTDCQNQPGCTWYGSSACRSQSATLPTCSQINVAGDCSGAQTSNLCSWLVDTRYSFLHIINSTLTNETVGTGSTLSREWYYRAFVNDTNGAPVNGANVTAVNSSNSFFFTTLTDVTGFTPLLTIVDYINTGVKMYYSLYNITASKLTRQVTHTYNASLGSNYSDYFSLTETTIPNCTIVSRTPTDIADNSTGPLTVIINCTDASGINVTKLGDHYSFFITRTVDAFVLAAGIPNYWSNRYPNNSLGVVGTLTPPYKVWRALGRNEGYWYENISSLKSCTGLSPCYQPLNDTFSYAIEDGEYGHFTVTNTSTTATINYTHPAVDVAAFRQSIYLSYESMVQEGKKNYTVRTNNFLLTKRFDAEAYRNTPNYTMNSFRDIGSTATAPTKTLRAFYCNSSYNPAGATTVLLSPNCVLINSIVPADLSNIIFTDRNSSYSKGAYAITNGRFGGIVATAEFYIEYESDESAANRGYNVRYVNGSTNTDVKFNDTNVAWTSTDGGVTWTQAAFTPDIFTTSVRATNDEFQFGFYICDLLDNCYQNFTMIEDPITPTNHPITNPDILEYNSTATLNDVHLNETHNQIMNIRIGVAKDPDSVGNVTHNLTLRNLDGTWNYTINGSFLAPLDAPIWINFNTTLVPDARYRMNILATSGDNPLDTKNRTTDNNFTVHNQPPYFTGIPGAVEINYTQGFGVGFNATDVIQFGSWAINWTTRFTINQSGWLQNSTPNLAAGLYYINVTINDSLNYINSTIFLVNISKAVHAPLVLTATTPITYGTATNFAGVCPSYFTCSLNITNGIFPAGTVSANYSTAGNENYTATSSVFTVTIDKAAGGAKLLINNVRGNFTATHKFEATNINITGYSTVEVGPVSLYINGTLYNNQSNAVTNITNLSLGFYNSTAIFEGSQNYTAASETWWINFTAMPATIIFISPVQNQTFNTQPISFLISADEPVESCWSSTDSGATNTSFTYPSGSLTGLTFGTHYYLTAYCNDSLGLIGHSTVEFNFTSGMSDEEKLTWIYIILLGLAIVFFIIGYKGENILFVFSSGVLFLVVGVYLTINGFPGIDNVLLTVGSGIVIIGIGAYLIIVSGFEWFYESGKGIFADKGGEEDD